MADYPNITALTDLDATTPAGTEVSSKLDDALRQVKYFLTQYLAVAHNADGTIKNAAVPLAGLADALITYAKIQNVSATDKVLGRSTAGAGPIEEIACTSFARSLLDDTDAATARTTLGLGAAALLATIGTANIDALAITTALLAANAVTTAKITDANVTNAKLAGAAATVDKMSLPVGTDSDPTLAVGATAGVAELTIGGVLAAAKVGSELVFSYSATPFTGSGAANSSVAYARIEEQRATGTSAGASAAGGWTDRTGWVENDPAGLVSVGGSSITFLAAGTYWLRATVPCSGAVGSHRCRLYDVTNATSLALGSSEQCPASTTTRSHLDEIVTIAAANTVLKLESWTQNLVATSGLGLATSQGDVEIYSIMEIVRLS